jgi:hypothetical protein
MLFLASDAFSECKAYATSDSRRDKPLEVKDMIFKVFDIHGVRLYGIFFHASKMPKNYWILATSCDRYFGSSG